MGHVCQCGERHRWTLYVYAHQSETLVHTCKCGIKTKLRRLMTVPKRELFYG